ncbi:MAG: hypothetical protein R3F20_08320 [Planctomycetota bacterium]
MRSLVVAIALLVLPASVLAQEAAPPVNPTRLEAAGRLAQARKAQLDREKKFEVTTFRGEFRVRLYDYTKPDQPKITDGKLLQYWAVRNDPKKGRQTRYRRELKSDATSETLVLASDWDGYAWRRNDAGKKEGPRVALVGRDHEADAADLAAEKRRVDELFRLFVLESLPVDATTLRMGIRGDKFENRFGRNVETVVADQILFRDERGNAFELWLATGTHQVVKARIRFHGEERWETFTMAQPQVVPLPDGGKLTVPANVAYHDEQGRPVLLLSTGEVPAESFRFNDLGAKELGKLFPNDE